MCLKSNLNFKKIIILIHSPSLDHNMYIQLKQFTTVFTHILPQRRIIDQLIKQKNGTGA